MSGGQNAALRDQTEQFFRQKAIVFEKNMMCAPGHALGGAVRTLRVDLVKVGVYMVRDVIAVRPWKADQPHGTFSTAMTALWIPYTQRAVVEDVVGDASYLFTAEITGCTATLTRRGATTTFAHIADDYKGTDRTARIGAASFVWGPAQYDPLVAGQTGFVSHFLFGKKRSGRWEFWAQGKVCGMDTYKPTVLYSERVYVAP